jgi:putative membrane protein
LSGLYLWIKAFHVVAAFAWMAGLFYLPRLFVYHAAAVPGSELSETLKVMERRLLRAIMVPAMLATWGLGLLLLWMGGETMFRGQAWMPVKLALVVGLTGFHIRLAAHRRSFALDRNRHPARYFRLINEIPTVLLVGIVVMVIVRPF